MSLVIFDCCNVFPSYRALSDIDSQINGNFITKEMAERIFRDFSGSVVACAASVGKYAYFAKSGSIFSMHFHVSLATARKFDTWYTILRNTRNSCLNHKQLPCYEIHRKTS